jgi:methyl-accepting chemotaxis protein
MQSTDRTPAWLNKQRRRVEQILLNYPLDLPNIAMLAIGGIMTLASLLSGAPWTLAGSGLAAMATGLLGLYIVRSRHALYGLRITLLGATGATLIGLVAFAPYPIWWLSLVPMGTLISALVVYYWGLAFGGLWYLLQALTALLGVTLAANQQPSGDLLLALISGEMTLFVLHTALLLLMPQEGEAQARNTAITRQSDELENLSLQISATADGLGRASTAIRMVTSQQGSGAEQQAAVITQAVTMLNEFIALADQVRNQARTVAELSEQTADVSEQGQQAIHTTIDAMTQIRAQVTVIAHNIASLAEQMQRIDEIIASVGEIATQSSLLALNASIEAARAGAQGRGFAVVADEVRTLSEQSKLAAAQVQSILTEIQDAMKQTVRATEVGDQQVDQGLNLSHQTGDTVTQLAGNVNETATAMRSIMIAIDEQATGLEQITKSMRNIHEVTQTNLESTRTAEIVAENLNRLSEELLVAVNRHGIDADPNSSGPPPGAAS